MFGKARFVIAVSVFRLTLKVGGAAAIDAFKKVIRLEKLLSFFLQAPITTTINNIAVIFFISIATNNFFKCIEVKGNYALKDILSNME